MPTSPRLSLFVLQVQVGRGTNAEMPAHLAGAFVPAFATAMDHESAARAAVYALGRQGFLFQDIQGPIHQLDATRWNEYVQSTWPELAAHFPPQSEVVQMLGTESVFFGPFAGYESAGVAQ